MPTATCWAGDSFGFPGKILHAARNKSDKPVRLIWVNSPVVMPKYAAHEDANTTPVKARTAQKKSTGT